ncbi:MAG: L-glyceraldehyde 3-phosphate reductase [Treponema sp.]|nr:L-glyceraldehyde 3-phosphate reductase [Treponema sp.]
MNESTAYLPAARRYDAMPYRRCGSSGLSLSALSLGFWHNFGGTSPYENARAMARTAFDLGITHFDLANNYGPPPGSAEECLGRLLRDDFAPFRDELVISTKAGYTMWPGPYGDHGSRKYLLASLDASLRRMGLDYVDIFYSHRPDPDTPLEETMGALAQALRSGKALYVGISNYPADRTAEAAKILRGMGVRPLIHQPRYHMFDRALEGGLLEACAAEGMGVIAFMPLAQGLLSSRYLDGLPADSRAASPSPFLTPEGITPEKLSKVRALNDLAAERGQSLAQMALRWTLRDERVTSALIGASRSAQVEENVAAFSAPPLSAEELAAIERILAGPAGA